MFCSIVLIWRISTLHVQQLQVYSYTVESLKFEIQGLEALSRSIENSNYKGRRHEIYITPKLSQT